jgi:nitroimidazol reductase NimA-like FMN-containing flavoprotein (pyridoxamine 5'-phosphate oxidase superfamily)
MNDGTAVRFAPSTRSKARRRPQRATYDEAAVFAALDSGILAHVGWVLDGQPYVTPTARWRRGRPLFWHGSAGSRMLSVVGTGAPACVTVSTLDGLVAGRSGMAHSINYHSVMAFGRPARVNDAGEKRLAMAALIDRIYPGRSTRLRPTTDAGLDQVTVVRMEIEEASLKAREGPPANLAEDEGWTAWAGVIPVECRVGAPVADSVASNEPAGDLVKRLWSDARRLLP